MEKRRDFVGKWITSDELCDLAPVNVFHRELDKREIKSAAGQNKHVLFRKRFEAKANDRTVIYISADDFYKLYINGKFVCMGPTAGYPFHYYYNEVDITDFITAGENTVAVHTYYQGLINRVWVSGDDRHGLICDIVQDGSVLASSDESFLYSYHEGFSEIGKYGYDTQFAQRYESGTKSENFCLTEYDDSAWKNAKIKKYADWELFCQESKIPVFEEIRPVAVKEDENGVFVDFGGIYVGYLAVEAKGEKGECVELLFGQELSDDGKVRHNLRANCNYREEWILSGGDDCLNEYDYKSFRYVRLNAKSTEFKNIRFIARHYPFELKAALNTDDEKLLSVWNLCVNSLKYGVQDVIQDCMEREKGFYVGDGCITALAHAVLTKDTSLIRRLTDEALRTSFVDKGLLTCLCCSFMQEIAEYPLYMPYMLYGYYALTGDKEYLAEKFDGMCEVMQCYRERYMDDDFILKNVDKWCVVDWPANYRDGYDAELPADRACTDVHNVINAHYIGAVKYMNKIAKLIGRTELCDEEPLIKAFADAFYDKESGLFRDNVKSNHISVPGNAFAFMYGLYPDDESEARAVEYFKEKGITSVNFFSSYAIMCGLKRMGNKKQIYEFLSDENAWLKMLSEDATRTFEAWKKDGKWNTSLLHLTLSYPVIFLTDWECN